MSHFIKRSLLLLGSVLTLIGFTQSVALAQIDCGSSEWSQTAYCADQVGANGDPILGQDGLFTNILQVIIIVITIASVITIAIGGLRLTFSNGDPQTTSSARQAIIYALVGLAVATVAQAIVAFVLNKL